MSNEKYDFIRNINILVANLNYLLENVSIKDDITNISTNMPDLKVLAPQINKLVELFNNLEDFKNVSQNLPDIKMTNENLPTVKEVRTNIQTIKTAVSNLPIFNEMIGIKNQTLAYKQDIENTAQVISNVVIPTNATYDKATIDAMLNANLQEHIRQELQIQILTQGI